MLEFSCELYFRLRHNDQINLYELYLLPLVSVILTACGDALSLVWLKFDMVWKDRDSSVLTVIWLQTDLLIWFPSDKLSFWRSLWNNTHASTDWVFTAQYGYRGICLYVCDHVSVHLPTCVWDEAPPGISWLFISSTDQRGDLFVFF